MLTTLAITGDRLDPLLWITQYLPSPVLTPLPTSPLTPLQPPHSLPLRAPLDPFTLLYSLLNPYSRSLATLPTPLSRISKDHSDLRHPRRRIHDNIRNESSKRGGGFTCPSYLIGRLARYYSGYDTGSFEYWVRDAGHCHTRYSLWGKREQRREYEGRRGSNGSSWTCGGSSREYGQARCGGKGGERRHVEDWEGDHEWQHFDPGEDL